MKTRRVLYIALFLLSIVLPTKYLLGQSTPTSIGKPTGAAVFPIEHGFVDLSNGNVHLEIPIEGYKQRGNVQTPAAFVYDSSIWAANVNSTSGTGSWSPTNVPDNISYYDEYINTSYSGWRFNYVPDNAYSYQSGPSFACTESNGSTVYIFPYEGFTWYDRSSTAHTFVIQTVDISYYGCTNSIPYKDTPSGSAYATDGSGYYATVTNYSDVAIWAPDGTQVVNQLSSQYIQVDRNGNYLSCVNPEPSTCVMAADTLGRNPISVTSGGVNSNGETVEYLNVITTAGAKAQYTITYEPITLKTDFGINGISEFSGSVTTIASIGLPDGTSYSFSYENGTYGELTGITLPHGGVVDLSYTSNSSSGTTLPARWLSSHTGSNGATSFAMAYSGTTTNSVTGNSCELTSDTVINAPSQTKYNFQSCGEGTYDYEDDYYQSNTSSTLISKTLRSYDYTHKCANIGCFSYGGTQLYQWVNVTGMTQVLLDSSLTADIQYSYATPGTGVPTTVKQWDFYSAKPSSLPDSPSGLPTREVDQVLGYNVNGALFPTSTTYKNSAGTAISQVAYAYDGNSLTAAPSTTPNLQSVSGNRGNLTTLTATDPILGVSHVSSFYYDTAGQIQSVKDPNLNVTSFTYDSTDTFPTKTCAPSTGSVAHCTSKAFDTNTGQVTSYTDQNSQTSTYNYDSIGRLQSVTFSNAGSPVTLSTIQHPSANETDITVQQSPTSTISISKFTDEWGRQSRAVQSGVSTEWTYDSHGRLYSKTNPHIVGTTSSTDGTSYFTYDELGRILTATNPLGQSISNSYTGNTRTVTDPIGHQRELVVDSFGDLTSVIEPNNSNTLSWITTYQYNGLGQLSSVNQKGGTTNSAQWRTRTFNHNGFGYLTSQTTPEAGTTSFIYDNDGNLKSSTDARGLATSYTYDALNRVISKTIQNGATHTYSYDAQDSSGDQYGMGMLTHITNGSSTDPVQANFTHNPFGYLTSETFCLPSNCANAYVATDGRDYLGNVTSLTYPDGRALSMTYNNLNQLTSESWSSWNGTPESVAYLYGVTYYPPGEVATATYGNGVSLKATYDANQNLKTLGYAKSEAVVSCKAYSWQSNAANLQSITDEVPGVTRTFTYDQLDRLQSVSDSGGSNPLSESYSFDAWGNLQQSGNFSFVQAFGANNQISTGGYSYDAAGNLLSEPSPISNSYSYGADGLLTGSNGAAYTYDSFGQRVRKDNGNTSQEYFYFGGGLLGMRNPSTGAWTDHIYGAGRFIASVVGTSSATPTWRVGDHLDSLSYQTDNNGNVTSSTNVSPYGQLVADNSGDEFPFTGHERDAENGTDHTLFRHYSPGQGRWIAPDPSNGSYSLADPQSLNRYSYLTNRPMNRVDRLGLDEEDAGDDDDDDDDGGGGGGGGGGDGGGGSDGSQAAGNPFPTDTSNVPILPNTGTPDCGGDGCGGALVFNTGGNSAISTGDSSADAAPSDGGSTSVASGTGSDSVAGDILLGGLMLLGNVPEVGTFANAALAGYYLAKGQYGQAALFGGAALYSTFGGVGGSEIAEGVEALNAAAKISETAVEAAEATTAAEEGVSEGTTVYRVFGENNNPLGQSWTRVDPSSVANYRSAAGLPDINTGRFVVEGTITDTTGITTRSAFPLDGNPGGLDEVVIPNASSQVQITNVSGVNPEF
jgi:RHS repeat-associated protein